MPSRAATFVDETMQYFGVPQLNAPDTVHAAFGDYNNDGWTDLCYHGTVYENNNGKSFVNTGISTSRDSLWGDTNNDGYLDLIRYGYSTPQLWQNNSGTNFTNVTGAMPSLNPTRINGAALADLNNDGYLDIYVGGYESDDSSTYYPDSVLTYDKSTNKYDITWTEPNPERPGRGITIADYNRDGNQDVYVSNYRLEPNYLWQSNSSGGMTNMASQAGVAGAAHTIGSAWGDFDNDGYLDLFVANFSHSKAEVGYQQEPAHFMKNLGPSGGFAFQDMKDLRGVNWQESYASAALADFDNDGKLDLLITTVYDGDHTRLYHNDGNWNFTDVTAQWGLSNLGPTYEAAWSDVNHDGFPDLLVDGKLFINEANNGNHWLELHLIGNGTTVNSAAIGTQVVVHAGDLLVTRQVEGGTGEGNQNDLTLDFGLGAYSGLLTLDIYWPDGRLQEISNVGVDQLMTIPEPSTLALALVGLGSVAWRLRLRRRARNESLGSLSNRNC